MSFALDNQSSLSLEQRDEQEDLCYRNTSEESCAVWPNSGVYIVSKLKISAAICSAADVSRIATAKARVSKCIKKQSG